jgi:valyl-tRNA synthetase
VWYRGEEITVGEAPEGEGWTQDPDTLDTWFSSGAWTFTTLGWPNETPDLARFHPTDVLETGYDILFFWIARMILMSQFALNTIPFHTVYLHGIVRDAKGRKFSKSLGNGIDPNEMAAKFGADAVRMSLVVGNTPGTDMRLSEDKIKGYKHFANKLWNIARFVHENGDFTGNVYENVITDADKTLIAEFDALAASVTQDMEDYRLYIAAEKLYHYVWDRFAAEILEESKVIMKEDGETTQSRKETLVHILANSLILLHPFIPFVTEEIWQSMPPIPGTDTRDLLIVARWPQ